METVSTLQSGDGVGNAARVDPIGAVYARPAPVSAQTNVVSIGTSSTLLAAALEGRLGIVVANIGTGPVTLIPGAGPATDNDFPLAPGEKFEAPNLPFEGAFYAKGLSGTESVVVMEFWRKR